MHKYVHTIYLSFFNRTWTVDTDSRQGVAIVHICAVTIKNRKTYQICASEFLVAPHKKDFARAI
jgi:hypothetical protein